MFYGQCWKCGERWNLGTASTCTCEPEQSQRWVGLTDEERKQVINTNISTGLWHMAKDIENKLRNKNDH